jgi:hypothetical protein
MKKEVFAWEKAINGQNAGKSLGEPMESVVQERKRKNAHNVLLGNSISSF